MNEIGILHIIAEWYLLFSAKFRNLRVENKKGFDGKSVIAQCFCINDGATLILFGAFSIFFITQLGDLTLIQHQETTHLFAWSLS